METEGELVTEKLYFLYESGQGCQQSPFHSHHLMFQIYCEAEAHVLNISIVCLKQRASSIVLFVA